MITHAVHRETGQTSWDYVIVGAGSAGAVLAGRLSEDPSKSVLLIEAGPNYRSSETPAAFLSRNIDMNPEHNPAFWWPGICARRHRLQDPQPYLRGRGLGGCSTVNGLCAIRGIPDDYDEWMRLGAAGWSFEDVLPAFVALEDEHDFPDAPWHGRGGPVPIYREPESGWGGVDHAFAQAVLDAGHGQCPDHNSPDSTGLSPFAMNIRGGRRVSTNDGYLEPARERPNLTILGNVQANCLQFAAGGTTQRITGIRTVGGDLIRIGPTTETIVACGAAHSASLLIRSGIGPAEQSKRLGIQRIADLPVGEGAQDHAMILVAVPTRPAARISRDLRVTNCVLRYSSDIGSAGRNDMMLLANNGANRECSYLIAQQQQSFSSGTLSLRSADPLEEPTIEHDLLSDTRDLRRMQDALDRISDIAGSKAFRSVLEGEPELPEKERIPFLVRDMGHLSGTCRMGDPADKTTVVDAECRVPGIERLRVIDASVMPAIPRANIYLSVLMLAEVMARRIIRRGAAGAESPDTAT